MSIEDIARRWSVETGGGAEPIERDLRKWLTAFVELSAAEQFEVAKRAGVSIRLLTRLADRRLVHRDVLQAYCHDRGLEMPRFWPGAAGEPLRHEPSILERLASRRPAAPGAADLPDARRPSPDSGPPPKTAATKGESPASLGQRMPERPSAAAAEETELGTRPRRRRMRGRPFLAAGILTIALAAALGALVVQTGGLNQIQVRRPIDGPDDGQVGRMAVAEAPSDATPEQPAATRDTALPPPAEKPGDTRPSAPGPDLAAARRTIEDLTQAAAASAAEAETAKAELAAARQDLAASRRAGAAAEADKRNRAEAATAAGAKAEAAMAELAAARTRIDDLSKELDTARANAKAEAQKLTQTAESATAEAARLKDELAAARSDLAASQRGDAAAETEKQNLTEAAKAAAAKAEAATAELAAARTRIDDLSKELDTARANAKAEAQKLTQTAESASAEAASLNGELAAARRKVQTLTAEAEAFDRDTRRTGSDLAAARQEIKTLSAAGTEAEARIQALTQTRDASIAEARSLKERLDSARQRIATLIATADSSAAEARRLTGELASAREALDTLRKQSAEADSLRGELARTQQRLATVTSAAEASSAETARLGKQLAAAHDEVKLLRAASDNPDAEKQAMIPAAPPSAAEIASLEQKLGPDQNARPAARQPAAPAPSAPAPPSLDAVDPNDHAGALAAILAQGSPELVVGQLMARGDQLLARGDIASARLFYELAVDYDSVAALTAVGKTYDPGYLRELGVVGVRGDAAKAREWYRRAADRGDEEARARLQGLPE